MHGFIVTALTANPILTLFIVIGLGYLLGEISFFGFRFGKTDWRCCWRARPSHSWSRKYL